MKKLNLELNLDSIELKKQNLSNEVSSSQVYAKLKDGSIIEEESM